MNKLLTLALMALISHTAIAQSPGAVAQSDDAKIEQITPKHRSVEVVHDALKVLFPTAKFFVDQDGNRIYYHGDEQLTASVRDFLKRFDSATQEPRKSQDPVRPTVHTNDGSAVGKPSLSSETDSDEFYDSLSEKISDEQSNALYVATVLPTDGAAHSIANRLKSRFVGVEFAVADQGRHIYFEATESLRDKVRQFLIQTDSIEKATDNTSVVRRLETELRSLREGSPRHLHVTIVPKGHSIKLLKNYLGNLFFLAEFISDPQNDTLIYRGFPNLAAPIQVAVREFEKSGYPESWDDFVRPPALLITQLSQGVSLSELRREVSEKRSRIEKYVKMLAAPHASESALVRGLESAIREEFCYHQAALIVDVSEQSRKLSAVEERLKAHSDRDDETEDQAQSARIVEIADQRQQLAEIEERLASQTDRANEIIEERVRRVMNSVGIERDAANEDVSQKKPSSNAQPDSMFTVASPGKSGDWDGPSPVDILRLKPLTESALGRIETPSDKEVPACSVAKFREADAVGYRLQDKNGTTLQEFLDTNNDRRIAVWKFFNDGKEFYCDRDFDGKDCCF